MGFLDSVKSLFSADEKPAGNFPAEEYKGFTITPTPQKEGGQFRVCGLITRGEQSHQFFRADLLSDADACAAETLRKAKITIDQLGDGIFR
ncbi:MAG: HlyU family transcriptional regulator [Thiolinea sp.]